jgi:hypothetical protein
VGDLTFRLPPDLWCGSPVVSAPASLMYESSPEVQER